MKKVEVRLLAELMNGSRKSDRELASACSWIPFNGLTVNNSSTSTAMLGLPFESPLAHNRRSGVAFDFDLLVCFLGSALTKLCIFWIASYPKTSIG